MRSARVAISGGLRHIEEQVKAIERAVVENPGLAFDLARAVVESACKTILMERAITFNSEDNLQRLFREVVANLPLLPVTASSEVEARRSLDKTLNGLNTALQGVCELRNDYGFASHGAEGPQPLMERIQAQLAAQAADAIIGFIYSVHRQERASLPSVRLEYDDNKTFNDYLDETNDVAKIFDLEFQPSEVLFNVDQEAYRDLLSDFASNGTDAELPIENETPELSA